MQVDSLFCPLFVVTLGCLLLLLASAAVVVVAAALACCCLERRNGRRQVYAIAMWGSTLSRYDFILAFTKQKCNNNTVASRKTLEDGTLHKRPR